MPSSKMSFLKYKNCLFFCINVSCGMSISKYLHDRTFLGALVFWLIATISYFQFVAMGYALSPIAVDGLKSLLTFYIPVLVLTVFLLLYLTRKRPPVKWTWRPTRPLVLAVNERTHSQAMVLGLLKKSQQNRATAFDSCQITGIFFWWARGIYRFSSSGVWIYSHQIWSTWVSRLNAPKATS